MRDMYAETETHLGATCSAKVSELRFIKMY